MITAKEIGEVFYTALRTSEMVKEIMKHDKDVAKVMLAYEIEKAIREG